MLLNCGGGQCRNGLALPFLRRHRAGLQVSTGYRGTHPDTQTAAPVNGCRPGPHIAQLRGGASLNCVGFVHCPDLFLAVAKFGQHFVGVFTE